MKEINEKHLETVESVLNVNPVVFDSISFERHGFRNLDKSVNTEFELSYAIKQFEDNHYCVTLHAVAKRKEEYTAKVQISGYCQLRGNLPDGVDADTLLRKNAIAILFPYVRSEMTLLTSQPEVEPIVWPVMNILAMLEQGENQNNEH